MHVARNRKEASKLQNKEAQAKAKEQIKKIKQWFCNRLTNNLGDFLETHQPNEKIENRAIGMTNRDV